MNDFDSWVSANLSGGPGRFLNEGAISTRIVDLDPNTGLPNCERFATDGIRCLEGENLGCVGCRWYKRYNRR